MSLEIWEGTWYGIKLNFLDIMTTLRYRFGKSKNEVENLKKETNVKIRKTVESVYGILIHLQISFALCLNISNEEFF